MSSDAKNCSEPDPDSSSNCIITLARTIPISGEADLLWHMAEPSHTNCYNQHCVPHLIFRPPVLCDRTVVAGKPSGRTLKSDLCGTKPGCRFAFGSGLSEPNIFFIQPGSDCAPSESEAGWADGASELLQDIHEKKNNKQRGG